MGSGGRRAAVLVSAAVLLGSAVAVQPAQAAATPAECTTFATGGTATGTSGDDVICGSEGADVIRGYGGNDTIFGLGGDDYIDAGSGADVVQGNDGDDEILLGSGDDTGSGGPGKDRMFGQDGNDSVLGRSGDDSLSGGAGVDSLDGGYGIDYCRKDGVDTLISCYYDTSKPQIAWASVKTPSVDTSAAPAVVTVRARVQDTGTGVGGFRLVFYRKTADGLLGYDGIWIGGQADIAEYFCTSDGHAPEPTQPGGGGSTICRTWGGANDGVYELKYLLPRWTPKGTYVLGMIDIADAAGNTRSIYEQRIVERNLDVRFAQTGAGDPYPPKVRDIRLLNSSVDTSAGPRVVGARIRVTDGLSGVADAQIYWSRYANNDFGTKDPQFISWALATDAELCTDTAPTAAQLISGERRPYCREAGGTKLDAWYRTWIVLPRWTGQGTYHLLWVTMSDRAGNNSMISSQEVDDLGLARSFQQTGAGDETAPSLSEITVVTPHVDAGVDSVPITVTARVKDGLSGMSSLELAFYSQDGSNQYISLWAWDRPCDAIYYEGCRLSGTNRDGVYTLTGWLPAHSAAGTWKLDMARIVDNAGNLRYRDESTLSASFTNS